MEHIMKCDVCGQIFTYTDKDIKDSAVTSLLAGLGGIATALAGSSMDMVVANQNLDRAERQTVDRNRCPNCKSSRIHELSEREIRALQNQEAQQAKQAIVINANASNESLLKRAALFLEDHEWEMANAYCESVLDVDPETAQAYLYKMLVEHRKANIDELVTAKIDYTKSQNYTKFMRFSNINEKQVFLVSIKNAKDKVEKETAKKYQKALSFKENQTKDDLTSAYTLFKSLGDYKDSAFQAEACIKAIELINKQKEEHIIAREKIEEIKKEILGLQEKLQRKKNEVSFTGFGASKTEKLISQYETQISIREKVLHDLMEKYHL